jgi:CubicO group peptidase (beta-lactamase class C family)
MQSSLEWDEDYGGISDVTKMLFLSKDMGDVQVQKQLVAAPTEIWNYSSGTSNLLSKNLRSYFDLQQEYIDFMYTDFADQIGMNSLLVEQDGSGIYVGSSYGWASTRDWGRFGQLYLQKGMWNGKELFDSSWVDYITTPTEHSDGAYGAHFWLNAGGTYPNVPRDLFSANGHDGQFVYIIPSEELVVVRTGLSEGNEYSADLLLSEIIKSIED